MKTLLPTLFFCCSVIFAFGQPPQINGLSRQAQLEIDTLYSIVSNRANHKGRANADKKFVAFLKKASVEDALILSQTNIFLSIACNRLLELGYSNIDIIRLRLNNKINYYHLYPGRGGCWVGTIPDEPNWTTSESIIAQLSLNELEKDTLLEILLSHPSKYVRLRNQLILNIENTPKRINWLITLAKEHQDVMATVPLIKYRYEENKDLIFNLLEKWLWNKNVPSTNWIYLIDHFDEIFAPIPEEKKLDLFQRYVSENPNCTYLYNVLVPIINSKNATASQLIDSIYTRLNEGSYVLCFADIGIIDEKYVYRKLSENIDSVYIDLYYKLWEEYDFMDKEIFLFLREKTPIRFKNRIYYFLKKHQNLNFSRYDLPLRAINIHYYLSLCETEEEKQKALLDLLKSTKGMMLWETLHAVIKWNKEHGRDKKIQRALYDIFTHHSNINIVSLATKAYVLPKNKRDVKRFLKWYEQQSSDIQKNEVLKKQYNNLKEKNKN